MSDFYFSEVIPSAGVFTPEFLSQFYVPEVFFCVPWLFKNYVFPFSLSLPSLPHSLSPLHPHFPLHW